MDIDPKVVLAAAALAVALVATWVKNARDDGGGGDIPPRLGFYVLYVSLAAAGCAWLAVSFTIPPGTFGAWDTAAEFLAGSAPGRPSDELATWFAVTTFMAALSLLLPMGRSRVSAASICDVAGTVVLGPAGAMAVAALSDLLCNLGRRPWLRVIFNVAQVTLTVGVAALAYRLTLALAGLLGVPSPLSAPTKNWLVLPYIAIPALVYHVLNTRLVAGALHFGGRGPLRKILEYNFAWQLSLVAVMLIPFGAALVISWQSGGMLPRVLACLAGMLAGMTVVTYLQQRAAVFDVVRTFATEIDRSHESTIGHSERLAAYAVQIAWKMKLERRRVEDLEFAAWLHNLGTVAMKHSLFLDASDLSPEAREATRRHPRVAHDMIRNIPALRRSAEVLLHHQRHVDGSGYPEDLPAEIPLESKILLVADAFDAVCTGRSHRNGQSRDPKGPDGAIAHLRADVGKQFDKDVLDALAQLHAEGQLTSQLEPEAGLAAAHRYAVRVLALEWRERLRQAFGLMAEVGQTLFPPDEDRPPHPRGPVRRPIPLEPHRSAAEDRPRASGKSRRWNARSE